MIDEFEKHLAKTLNLKLDADGCGEDGLYGYLLHTVPVFRGKRGRPTYDLALAQRTREFFRSMVECFEGMCAEHREHIKIKFDEQHARNVVSVFLEMPDCRADVRIHTWPAWLGLQIYATWLFRSGYFSNLAHPDEREKRFTPANTLGCFFSGWWYGYLLWREDQLNDSKKLIAWLVHHSPNNRQHTYHKLVHQYTAKKAISESYRHRRTVTEGRGIPCNVSSANAKLKSPTIFLMWLLGRLDYFWIDGGTKKGPIDYTWIKINDDKSWPFRQQTLINLNDFKIADGASLGKTDERIKGDLLGFADRVFEKRDGDGGCARVARNRSYTDSEISSEKELEVIPGFLKTVLFNWPFLFAPPCKIKRQSY